MKLAITTFAALCLVATSFAQAEVLKTGCKKKGCRVTEQSESVSITKTGCKGGGCGRRRK